MTGKDDGKDKLGDMNFKSAVNCQLSSVNRHLLILYPTNIRLLSTY